MRPYKRQGLNDKYKPLDMPFFLTVTRKLALVLKDFHVSRSVKLNGCLKKNRTFVAGASLQPLAAACEPQTVSTCQHQFLEQNHYLAVAQVPSREDSCKVFRNSLCVLLK